MSVLSRLTGVHINLSGRPKAPKLSAADLANMPVYPDGAPTAANYTVNTPRIALTGVSPLNIGTGATRPTIPTVGGLGFNPGGTGTAVGAPTGIPGSVGGGFDWKKWLGIAGDVAGAAATGYGIYQSAQNAKDAKAQAAQGRALEQQAIDLAMQKYNDLAPLRAMGLGAIQNAASHPISPLEAVGGYVDAGNPYTRAPSAEGVRTAFTGLADANALGAAGNGAFQAMKRDGVPVAPVAVAPGGAGADPRLGGPGRVDALGGVRPLLTPAQLQELQALRARGML